MKRPVKILLILLAAVLLLAIVVAANVARSRSQVQGVKVSVRYGGVPHLVDEQAVADTIVSLLPDLRQQQVRHVDRAEVAKAASHVLALKDITASVSVSGKVLVKARQRRPIARLFYGQRELYFDSEGVLFPTSAEGDCEVLVATGDFVDPLRTDSLNVQLLQLVSVARFLDSHSEYAPLIDQIHIERDGDIMMVPKLGDHLIELGPADNLDVKFSHLLTFYRKGMPRAGWQTYSKVSLKYDGQVVCTKKSNKN